MNFNQIPEELKQLPIWCVWNLEKGGKIPYNPRTGYKAQSNNLESFTPFKTASKAMYDGRYNGVGIGIFYGISAIDIDHCINDGNYSDMANDIIQRMNSYTEISPSGNGIRIIFKAPDLQYNKELYYIHNQKRGLEIYVSGATSKFVTITGNVINDVPIANRTVALQEILDLYMRRTSAHMESVSIAAKKTAEKLKGTNSDSETNENRNRIPIKNDFIRKNIMSFCGLISIIFAFFPFASFCAKAGDVTGNKISVSGFETLFGAKEIKVGSNNSIFGLIILLVPIIIIVMNYIKPLKPFKKYITVGAPALGIIGEFITFFDLRGTFKTFIQDEGAKLSSSLGIGFFLILASFILTAVVGLMIYHGMELPKKNRK